MLTFHHTGDWPPGGVEVEWMADGRRRLPEIEALVEQAWARAKARPGVLLFDGPMCRLERSAVRPDGRRLKLSLSPTTYKPFLGTNLLHPELADRLGPDVMANPLGLSAALETADGFLLLGRRNADVAYYPGRVHPFAGSFEPGDGADVFAAMRRELHEELSLGLADVPEVRCTGLVEDAALRQPELIFSARSARGRAEIERRLDPAEHLAVVAIAAKGEAVIDAIRDPALTPVAVGALLLWGRLRLGQDWFDAARAAVGA